MKRAALYVRVSSAGQVRDGYSLSFQEQILQEFCQREALVVTGVYRDGGQSGSTTQRRELTRLIADARQRCFDLVLIFRVDRFSRDPLDLLALVRELEAQGIKLRSVTEAVDAGDPAGELMLTMLGAIGKFVRRNLIQNAMLGKMKRAETGRYTGGQIPFGFVVGPSGAYQPDRTPWWNGHTRAEVVEKVYALYLQAAAGGGGCGAVARKLNELGVPGPKSAWGHSSVYQILTNPCYAGDFAYNKRSHPLHRRAQGRRPQDWVWVRAAHEPVVAPAMWARVQELLRTGRGGGSRSPSDRDPARDLMTGFLRCGQCGAALTPRRPHRSQRHLYYTCASRYSTRRRQAGAVCRTFPWLRAADLENLVWPALVAATTTADWMQCLVPLLSPGRAPDLARVQAEVARQERRLEALAEQEMILTTAFAEGRLPADLWQKQLERLQAERAMATDGLARDRAQLADWQSQAPLPVCPSQLQRRLQAALGEWSTLAERRDALSILVGPGGIRVQADGTVELDLRVGLPVVLEPSPLQLPYRQDRHSDQK